MNKTTDNKQHPSLTWAPYLEKAKLIAKDAQLSNDAGVIARLLLAQAQRDAAVAALRQAHEALASIEGKARTRTIINAYCRADNAIAAAEGSKDQ